MKLESNTIGNVSDPTPDHIHAAFHDDREDVAGNIYVLRRDDGTYLSSVSGDYFEDFSLVRGDRTDCYEVCTDALTRDEVVECFQSFWLNRTDIFARYDWKTEQKFNLRHKLKTWLKRKPRTR